jgi:hypothetical protein
VSQDGKVKHPRVVDYYGEDEAIELGPDENMHDRMIETIAELSVKRGYVLGIGIMSSKVVGINHKQYGVTSTGVVKFAEIAMREAGVDIRKDPFSVKFTGGPNGDVAGNSMRLLLDRCPRVAIRLIVDGTGAVVDPDALDRGELSRIVLKEDVEGFDPARLSPGGFLLCRNVRRTEGLRELYKRVQRTASGLEETWVTLDEFHKEFTDLLFTVPADLFIPAGGRPETVDRSNWERFFGTDGIPTVRVIVEGANSFLTPEARALLQGKGIVVIRDASANKCGVISSSYEIIAICPAREREFLALGRGVRRRCPGDSGAASGQRGGVDLPAASGGTGQGKLHRDLRCHQRGDQSALRPALRLLPVEAGSVHPAALPPRALGAPAADDSGERAVPLAQFGCRLRYWHAVEIASMIVYRGGFERNFEDDLRTYVARVFA